MRPEDDIHKMIKKIHLKASAELDKRVQDDLSRVLAKTENAELAHAEPNIRQSTTKGGIVKLAIAAAILIAFGVGFSVGRWSQSPKPEPPSFDITAYTQVTQLYPTSPKTEDNFWRQKALAAMQPKPYKQILTTKTNLFNVYKQYLKEKDYD
jgi:hypothetical protein